ncbi:TonB-dependent receptor plug domain-containing protein [Chitinophaga barathri]|uniref:TonB-dependent receptor n=1 Tax=Chitinophaga barathri TaxID=1647451 RepID=A0A3N4MSH3_9BACT|nr:TonB-dependent receptor [Chitinophaga barathri]RPD42489.1 TonB-dependent receptor [Chitinophaga barathri]
MRTSICCCLFLLPVLTVKAQSPRPDTGTRQRTLTTVDVVHSVLKKEDDLIDIKRSPAPTLVISRKSIQLMGSRRLDEVLREQTGMVMVSDLGSGNRSLGLQMQGFSSEYILILLDGQPMTGRLSGNFDLSRIGVSDIERIEIIKGATSSLYGSDALGGVVNIITRQQVSRAQGHAAVRYGTYNTLDASLNGETPFRKQNGFAHLSANYYRTDGFNVNTEYLRDGKTSPPYHSITLQGRARRNFSANTSLQASARYASRKSDMLRSYGVQPFNDLLDERDLNTALTLNHSNNNGWRLLGRYYFTNYQTDQEVILKENGRQLQENKFSQQNHRLELQAGKNYNLLSLIGGAGGEFQQYRQNGDGLSNDMMNYFAYAQAQYQPATALQLTAGLRYDGNTDYGGKLNFSAGAGYRPAKWLKLNASFGNGFKAPTYAQMYQVFTNITQGYTVIGANIFHEKAKELKDAGTVKQVWSNAQNIRDLAPETSTSFNLGFTLNITEEAELTVNGFYHNIRNLINTEQFGIMNNGQQLFSYININKVFNRGLETSIRYSPLKGLLFTAGYQLLDVRSSDVLDSIRNHAGAYANVRTPEGIRPAGANDYFGLPNRSRHSGNAQIYYEYQPWGLGASFRASYRSKYGFLDVDNNGYIDQYDVFVEGYTLLYASIQKSLFDKRLTLRFSVDNLANFTNYLMPSQPGRVLMAGVEWHLRKRTTTPR